MIALHSEFSHFPQSVVEYSASKDGRFGWFLSTWHPEQDHILEEIQAQIKLEILSSNLQSVSKLNIEKWLKDFFADFHWKLHAQFRKTALREKGISLFFGVLFDHELFFVQFGRLVCAVTDAKSINPVGNKWQNLHVSSLEKLSLLGEPEKDIKVRTHRFFIPEKQKFIVLTAGIAASLFDNNPDPSSVTTLIEANTTESDACWLILEGRTKLLRPTRRRFTRLQVSTLVLLMISILTILYMVFGNRFIDQGTRKLKLIFQEKKTTRWEQIPNYLNLDSSNIIKQLERIVNMPARNIELRIAWSTDLPYTITATPVFNLDNIYIASDNKLLAYHKKSRELLWKLSLDANIHSMNNTRNALIAILDNNNVIAFKEDGKAIWQQVHSLPHKQQGSAFTVEMDNSDDPRLDGSIIIVSEDKAIAVLDGLRGEVLSRISFRGKLQYLSEYDRFENCFYAVIEDEILCIELKIIN